MSVERARLKKQRIVTELSRSWYESTKNKTIGYIINSRNFLSRKDTREIKKGFKLNRMSEINVNLLPTPTQNNIALRRADFATLSDALDYAADGETGANFYAGSGKLAVVLPYSALRTQALVLARRLMGLKLKRGARLAIVAETNPDFLRFFFACQYAGLVPVALPASINLGGHEVYVNRLRGLLQACEASVALASNQFLALLKEAAADINLVFIGTPAAFEELPEQDIELQRSIPSEIAYIQYTSGSTSFPRGVVITQQAVMANLFGVANHGVCMHEDDRCLSWLPFYHDMGLVGCLLVLMATQRSVDYIDTRDFAMRPRRWLELMTRTRSTISFSPPFGYELCSRRIKPEDVPQYDLSNWRIAGIGAEPIHTQLTDRFAKLMAPAGFNPRAFLPCYGMAESSVAISFSPLGEGIFVDCVDADHLAENLRVNLADKDTKRVTKFVRCGRPLPEHEVSIQDENGVSLDELYVGRIKVRGPSIMSGYFKSPKQTRKVLSEDGWLDTGDLGYMVDGCIVVTGRHKDMIIINGRNIWPQDIELIVVQQPELRSMDVSAFCVPGPEDEDVAVVVVQCNISDDELGNALSHRIHRKIHEALGINCIIELVPRHTLPRTSSGKLTRSAARADYLKRQEAKNTAGSDDSNSVIGAAGTTDATTDTQKLAVNG